MDILTYIHKNIFFFVAVLAVILLMWTPWVLKSTPKKLPQVFKPEGGQDFDESIKTFSGFSDRAKATFMYRFVNSLGKSEQETLHKYLSKHI